MMLEATNLTPAIDVHGHFGVYVNTEQSRRSRFMSATAEKVVARARNAGIFLTVASPLSALLPRYHAQAVRGNAEAENIIDGMTELLQWVVVNPLEPATYEQARRILKKANCRGIKIHPEEHGYPIAEHGEALFEFAAEQGAVVLTHSGEENSQPMDFLPFANRYPEVRIILAHLGSSWENERSQHVQAILASRHGNLFTDTSSASSIMPGLIEWAVREVGAEKILFGTDTPIYHTAMQRARIDYAELTDRQKMLILRDNAVHLLGISKNKASLQSAIEPATP